MGYTFGCWVQSIAVPYLEAPLLTWVDAEDGVPAVVVLLREQVGKLGLGVRIHVPEEDACGQGWVGLGGAPGPVWSLRLALWGLAPNPALL